METSEVSLIDKYSAALVESMQDHRVAAVLSGALTDRLDNHIRKNFIEWFQKVLDSGEFDFSGFPDDIKADPDVAEKAARFVEMEAGELQQVSVSAVAGLIGNFVLQNRAEVIAAMKAIGEGPGGDRPGHVAKASALVHESRQKVDALGAVKCLEDAEQQFDEIRDGLEEAREILGMLILDDAILYSATPAADEAVAGGLPAVTPYGRRIDVEDLLLESWIVEADAHVMLADKAGEPLGYCKIASEEQRQFILDAVVAIQEAITIRPEPALILRFGELRLAKGDVGEARAAARKLMEVIEDEEDELYVRASKLLAAVELASPLGKHDKRCFIATAAMGDVDAPQVHALRCFRDEVLMESGPGRAFVKVYYRLSPPAARFIADRPLLRAAVRSCLIVPAARAVRRTEIR